MIVFNGVVLFTVVLVFAVEYLGIRGCTAESLVDPAFASASYGSLPSQAGDSSAAETSKPRFTNMRIDPTEDLARFQEYRSNGGRYQGGWYLGKRTKNPWYLGKRAGPSKPGIWYLG